MRNTKKGFVAPSFGVSASGEVVDMKTDNFKLRKTFDRAVKQALHKWRYQPKLAGGSGVGMNALQAQIDFSFGYN